MRGASERQLGQYLTSQEDQNIALILSDMDLKHGDHASLYVVSLWLAREVDVHRVPPTWEFEDGGVSEVCGELLRIERC